MLVFALTACNKKADAQIRMYKSTDTLQSAITSQTTDTLTNTETTYFNVRTGYLSKFSTNKYAFYFSCDTTSGTPVTCSVTAQGSYNGINWFNLSGSALGTDGVNCDSLLLTAALQKGAQSKITCVGGTNKLSYGVGGLTFNGNNTPRVPYARLRFTQPSGTVALVISEVYCLPFNNQ